MVVLFAWVVAPRLTATVGNPIELVRPSGEEVYTIVNELVELLLVLTANAVVTVNALIVMALCASLGKCIKDDDTVCCA